MVVLDIYEMHENTYINPLKTKKWLLNHVFMFSFNTMIKLSFLQKIVKYKKANENLKNIYKYFENFRRGV